MDAHPAPLPEHARAYLKKLWSLPKARRYLARLILAARIGGKDERMYKWEDFAHHAEAACATLDHEVFKHALGWQNIMNFAYRKTEVLADVRDYNSIAYFLSVLFSRPELYPDEQEKVLDFRNRLSISEILDEFDLISFFQQIIGLEPMPADDFDRLWQDISSDAPWNTCRALQDFFRLQKHTIRENSKRLLDPHGTGTHEAHFICYRYATTPGHIVKSFLSLKPNQDESALPYFEHHYIDSQHMRRRANGYLIPMGFATYFLGNIDNGAGLKAIVLRPPALNRRFCGFILSMNSTRNPLISRTVLKRTPHSTPESANIACFSEQDLESHVQLEEEWRDPKYVLDEIAWLRRELRNYVASKPPEDIFDEHGRKVDQWAIISIVAEALNLNTELDFPHFTRRSRECR